MVDLGSCHCSSKQAECVINIVGHCSAAAAAAAAPAAVHSYVFGSLTTMLPE
jgi:hypothetical protein